MPHSFCACPCGDGPSSIALSFRRTPILISLIRGFAKSAHPRACVRCRFSKLDLELAQEWFGKGLELETIENAILLACSRKYISWLNGGNLNPIGSLRYFEQTLEEVRGLREKTPPEYWAFLKMRLKRIEHQWLSSQKRACENFAQAKKETR